MLLLMPVLRSRRKKPLVTVFTTVLKLTHLMFRNRVIFQLLGLTKQFSTDLALEHFLSFVGYTLVYLHFVRLTEMPVADRATEWLQLLVDDALVLS